MKTWLTLLILALGLASCASEPTPPAPATNTEAGREPDEMAALEMLRKVSEAQATYFKINRRYALTYDELLEARLLTAEPSTAESGYEFNLRPAADAQTYRVSVVPSSSGSTVRHFFVDQTGVIRSETGTEATAGSPEVK